EGALDGAPLFRNQPARERALDIFSQLRIWDTAHNNGVLIYLLLADHDFEIVADRGIDANVGPEGWEKICLEMEADFRAGDFEGGVLKGIAAVSRELAAHFPRRGAGPNELPDAPVVLEGTIRSASLRAKRSNPHFRCSTMDCFASLAMTAESLTPSPKAARPRGPST